MLDIEIDVVKGFESFVLHEIDEFKKQGFEFTCFEDWKNNEILKNPEISSKTEQEIQEAYQQHLIYEYSNLRQRLIPAKPRAILYAKDFIRIPEYEKGLQILEEKIKSGESLTPHLSRKILKARETLNFLRTITRMIAATIIPIIVHKRREFDSGMIAIRYKICPAKKTAIPARKIFLPAFLRTKRRFKRISPRAPERSPAIISFAALTSLPSTRTDFL